MSRTGAIIQARMGSTRLPGKVLMDICGKPVLQRVIERAQLIEAVDEVIVATTKREEDSAIVNLAISCGSSTFCGSEKDVLQRFLGAANEYSLQTMVRITADCPLLDPQVSSRVLAAFNTGYDYCSNVHPPTFPDGLDTEVFSFDVLYTAAKKAIDPFDREHVTPYVWRRPHKFRLGNLQGTKNLSSCRWTLDTEEDLRFIRRVYSRMLNHEPQAATDTFGMNAIINKWSDLYNMKERVV